MATHFVERAEVERFVAAALAPLPCSFFFAACGSVMSAVFPLPLAPPMPSIAPVIGSAVGS